MKKYGTLLKTRHTNSKESRSVGKLKRTATLHKTKSYFIMSHDYDNFK